MALVDHVPGAVIAVLAVGFSLGFVYWGLVMWRGAPDPVEVTAAPAL